VKKKSKPISIEEGILPLGVFFLSCFLKILAKRRKNK